MCGSEVLNTSVMIYWQTDWVHLINEGLQFSNPKEEAGSESLLLCGPSFQSIHSEFELGYPLLQLFHISLDCEKILPAQDLSSRTLDTTHIRAVCELEVKALQWASEYAKLLAGPKVIWQLPITTGLPGNDGVQWYGYQKDGSSAQRNQGNPRERNKNHLVDGPCPKFADVLTTKLTYSFIHYVWLSRTRKCARKS